MSEWNKFSDLTPAGSFWAYAPDTKQIICYRHIYDMQRSEPLNYSFTHWMPIDVPEPPKEPTQRELDDLWSSKIADECCGTAVGRSTFLAGVDYALNHRDEQVREILKNSRRYCETQIHSITEFQKLCRLVGY